MVALYDESINALSFVIPLLIKYLPIMHFCIGFLFSGLILAFLLRIVLSWYPQIDLKKGFWMVFAAPTEPFLVFTRKLVPPIGGVDVTPVIWVGLLSLVRELVVGQQGLLSQIVINIKT